MVAMRLTAALFAVALVVMVEALPNGTVQAKTTLQVVPASGPQQATVQVSGDGFCAGDVRIEIAPFGEPGGPNYSDLGFYLVDPSALGQLMPLATVTTTNGGFSKQVTLPAWDARAKLVGSDESSVYIFAIQPLHEGCSHTSGFFVTSVRYGVPGIYLTRAGMGWHARSRSPLFAIALLSTTGLALLAIGCVARRKSRVRY